MPNKLTGGQAVVGAMIMSADKTIKSGANHVLKVASNTVARTDTTAKNLFTIPANAVPIAIFVFGDTASDAGTTATIDIGKTGTLAHFVDDFDVKGATGTGLNVTTSATNIGSTVGTSDITVTGLYAETGAASTTGGDWTIMMLYR